MIEVAGVRQTATVIGDRGWYEDPNGRVRAVSGDELATYRLAHALLFQTWLDDPEPAGFKRADPAERQLGALEPRKDRLCLLQKVLRLGRRGQLALRPAEQFDPEAFLQPLDLHRDRGLGEVQETRRAGHAPGIGDSHQSAQGGKIEVASHDHHP